MRPFDRQETMVTDTPECPPQSARTRRLTADAALVFSLRHAGFSGPLYDDFVRSLAQYGLRVMRSWITSGRIYDETAGRGRPVARPQPPLDTDEITDLTAEIVATATIRFRRALTEGEWDPARGASLKSYFVTGCVLEFPNIARRREKERARDQIAANLVDPSDFGELLAEIHLAGSPEDVVVGRLYVEWLLNNLSAEEAEIIQLSVVQELPHADVAQAVGISVRAVEGRLYRARKVLRGMTGPRPMAQ